ncbi:MAG: hypothetical protein AAF191_19550, partial [Verrucomicrobiota bacterium]
MGDGANGRVASAQDEVDAFFSIEREPGALGRAVGEAGPSQPSFPSPRAKALWEVLKEHAERTLLSEKDLEVAWPIQIDLHTRIVTQKLKYREGTEAAALKSVYDCFTFIREKVEKTQGCHFMAGAMGVVLNEVLRPFTAKWHPLSVSGVLQSNDEQRQRLRQELSCLQQEIQPVLEMLEKVTGLTFQEQRLAGLVSQEGENGESAGEDESLVTMFEGVGG